MWINSLNFDVCKVVLLLIIANWTDSFSINEIHILITDYKLGSLLSFPLLARTVKCLCSGLSVEETESFNCSFSLLFIFTNHYFLFLWHLCSRPLNDIRSIIKHAEHVTFKNLSARSVCITAHTFKNTETQRAKLSSSCLVLFQSDICVIDGSCYEDGDVNPHNASQVCRVGQQTTLWTVVTSKSFPLLSLSQNTYRTVSKCLEDFHSHFLKLHIKCQTFFSFFFFDVDW